MSTTRTQPGQSGARRHASRAAFFSLTLASLVVACSSSSGGDKGSGADASQVGQDDGGQGSGADASQAAQDDGGQGGSSSGAMSGSGSGSGSGGGIPGVDSGSGGTTGKDAAGSCLGSSFLSALGKDRLLVGVSGSSTAEAAAPYDLRYVYISGGLF